MGLEVLVAGTIASVTPVNSNFSYLDGLINALGTTESGHYSSLTAADSSLSSRISTLESKSITALSGQTPQLVDGKVHSIEITANTTFALPTVTSTTDFHQFLILVSMPTAYTISWTYAGSAITPKYFYNNAPDLSQTGNYTIIGEYNGSNWVIGAMYKGA